MYTSLRTGVNQNQARSNLFDAIYHGTLTRSVSVLAIEDLSVPVIGYNADDMDTICNMLAYSGKWAMAYRGLCKLQTDPKLVEVINKLETGVTYCANYIDIGLPVNMVLRRISGNVTFVIFKDVLTNNTAIGMLDSVVLNTFMSTQDSDIEKMDEGQFNTDLFYSHFTVEYKE